MLVGRWPVTMWQSPVNVMNLFSRWMRNFLSLQVYEPFATDFGPINMGGTYRFCQKIKELLKVNCATRSVNDMQPDRMRRDEARLNTDQSMHAWEGSHIDKLSHNQHDTWSLCGQLDLLMCPSGVSLVCRGPYGKCIVLATFWESLHFRYGQDLWLSPSLQFIQSVHFLSEMASATYM